MFVYMCVICNCTWAKYSIGTWILILSRMKTNVFVIGYGNFLMMNLKWSAFLTAILSCLWGNGSLFVWVPSDKLSSEVHFSPWTLRSLVTVPKYGSIACLRGEAISHFPKCCTFSSESYRGEMTETIGTCQGLMPGNPDSLMLPCWESVQIDWRSRGGRGGAWWWSLPFTCWHPSAGWGCREAGRMVFWSTLAV